jgi:protein-tyrosine kinase
MDKIQAAIAKARATRNQQPKAMSNSAMAQVTPVGVSVADRPDPVGTAWAALGELKPTAAHMDQSHIATFGSGIEAMAFDALRTKVLQQMRAKGWRRVAITSPSAACGKSTVALNLAFSMARQADMRAILMDLDLRRPSLARLAGVSQKLYFADVLKGQSSFGQNALRYGANMALACNARVESSPSELLASADAAAALDRIEAEYAPDVMIFDMPPMLATDDMMAFASQVDCVLLLAAAEHSTIKEIDTCERELASQTNVLGVVLNKCRYIEQSYGYGY